MSEDVYRLTIAVGGEILADLNGKYQNTQHERFNQAMQDMDGVYSIEQAEDWIAALKSGKGIVNPMSPREELVKFYLDHTDTSVIDRDRAIIYKGIIEGVNSIIAKEHPDVKDWLKEDKEMRS